MSHLVINNENGRLIFFITYNLGFIIALCMFITRSIRKGNPAPHTMLAAAAGCIFFLLGMNISSVPGSELANWFSGGDRVMHYGRNLSGGMIGLLAGIIISSWVLKLKRGVLDDFAFALPVGMAIHRIGCLIEGCCYGRPSSLPWAVSYGAGSEAFRIHPLLSGPDAGMVSVPVHPVQAYEIILCMVLVFLLYRFRRRAKLPGDLFLYSIIFYCLIWFGCEWVRDPGAAYFAASCFAGMRLMQWIILAGILIMTMILVLRHKFSRHQAGTTQRSAAGSGRLFAFALVLMFLFITSGRRLELTDRLVILLILMPSLLLVSLLLFRKITVPGMRWGTALILVSALGIMSQVPVATDHKDKIRYSEITISGMWNGYTNTVQRAVREYSDCGGTYYIYGPDEDHRHNVYMARFSFSEMNRQKMYRQTGYYTNLFCGLDHEMCQSTGSSDDNIQIAANAGFRLDSRYFGMRTGMWLGYFKLIGITKTVTHVGDYDNSSQDLYVFPQLSFRLGPIDVCYLNLHLADVMPGQAGPVLFQAGLGTGFGKLYGSGMEIGFSSVGMYGQANIMAGAHLMFNVYLSNSWGTSMFSCFDNSCVSVGVTLRPDFKTERQKKYR